MIGTQPAHVWTWPTITYSAAVYGPLTDSSPRVQEQKEWGGRSGVSSPTHEGMLAPHKAIQKLLLSLPLCTHTTHSTYTVLPCAHTPHRAHIGSCPCAHTPHTAHIGSSPYAHTPHTAHHISEAHAWSHAIHTTDGQPCM